VTTRAPDPELVIDDRGVHEYEELLAPGSAAPIHDLEGLLGQTLGELSWVGDGRR
jgi:hypothetical protein